MLMYDTGMILCVGNYDTGIDEWEQDDYLAKGVATQPATNTTSLYHRTFRMRRTLSRAQRSAPRGNPYQPRARGGSLVERHDTLPPTTPDAAPPRTAAHRAV